MFEILIIQTLEKYGIQQPSYKLVCEELYSLMAFNSGM